MTQKEGPSTSHFSHRPVGYLVGVALLSVGTILCLVGFSCPFWHEQVKVNSTATRGLWLTCESPLSVCRQIVTTAEDWLRVVQFLQTCGMLLLASACVLVVVINLAMKTPTSRAVEVLAGLGTLLTVLGALSYIIWTLSPPDGVEVAYGWALGVNLAGGVLCLIAVILIAANNLTTTSPAYRRHGDSDSEKETAARRVREDGGLNPMSLMVYSPRRAQKGKVSMVRTSPHPDDFYNRNMWLLPSQYYWMSNV